MSAVCKIVSISKLLDFIVMELNPPKYNVCLCKCKNDSVLTLIILKITLKTRKKILFLKYIFFNFS